jgi:hypothetical protein
MVLSVIPFVGAVGQAIFLAGAICSAVSATDHAIEDGRAGLAIALESASVVIAAAGGIRERVIRNRANAQRLEGLNAEGRITQNLLVESRESDRYLKDEVLDVLQEQYPIIPVRETMSSVSAAAMIRAEEVASPPLLRARWAEVLQPRIRRTTEFDSNYNQLPYDFPSNSRAGEFLQRRGLYPGHSSIQMEQYDLVESNELNLFLLTRKRSIYGFAQQHLSFGAEREVSLYRGRREIRRSGATNASRFSKPGITILGGGVFEEVYVPNSGGEGGTWYSIHDDFDGHLQFAQELKNRRQANPWTVTKRYEEAFKEEWERRNDSAVFRSRSEWEPARMTIGAMDSVVRTGMRNTEKWSGVYGYNCQSFANEMFNFSTKGKIPSWFDDGVWNELSSNWSTYLSTMEWAERGSADYDNLGDNVRDDPEDIFDVRAAASSLS